MESREAARANESWTKLFVSPLQAVTDKTFRSSPALEEEKKEEKESLEDEEDGTENALRYPELPSFLLFGSDPVDEEWDFTDSSEDEDEFDEKEFDFPAQEDGQGQRLTAHKVCLLSRNVSIRFIL